MSPVRVPPTPGRRYVEEIGLVAMLAVKRSLGVATEVNHGERVTHMPLPSVNKAVHSGFESQRRHHQKSKTRLSVASQKRTYVLHIFF